jgi:hypothetical protein
MPEIDFITIFVSRLNLTGIRYMITGAVACIIYGEPRMTHDLDVVLEVGSNNVEKIASAFPPDAFYRPPVETLIIEAGRPLRGHFNLIHHETGLRADVYTTGEDPLHLWAMSNRKSFEIQGERVWLAPPEYVILRKLEFYREGSSDKHLGDIAGILEISSDNLNTDWLQGKIHDYGLTREWQEAKEKIKD